MNHSKCFNFLVDLCLWLRIDYFYGSQCDPISSATNRVNCNLRQNFWYKKSALAGGAAISSSNRHLHTASATTAIDELKATLREEVPFSTGVIPLDKCNSRLFYRNDADGSLGFIDFSTAVSDVQLEHLAQACQPATFGVEQKDVLDESYRKAEKMDAINLSTNFNSNNTGILHAICGLLLKNTESPIRVELHKLNVYGPGSFFKSHVDTPKGFKMFGSLVVVLPTKHEGGSFSLRHHGREWIFNSADIVSPQNSESPRAAFVAFFGDVEHEVSVVKSGYRVTLTYNLYFGDDKSTIVPSTTLRITEAKIKKSLLTLLNDEKFLPDGGLLGIGLTYQYPTNKNINLDELIESLKGTDAAIKRACDSLSLKASLKIVYNSSEFDGVACLVDKLELNDQVEEDMPFHLQETANGLLVFDSNMEPLSEDELARYGYDGMDLKPISWLRPLTERNKIETPYVRYGNEEATLDYVYGNICLVIEVETSEDRKIYL